MFVSFLSLFQTFELFLPTWFINWDREEFKYTIFFQLFEISFKDYIVMKVSSFKINYTFDVVIDSNMIILMDMRSYQ